MYQKLNTVISYNADRPLIADFFFIENFEKKPVIIYSHGFAGFKDWGNFNLIAQQFARAGWVFIKFNFTHNGTSQAHPEDFSDLEAFGNNNYSKQLADLQDVIDWANNHFPFPQEIDSNNIALVGHSLGGGISIIKAAEEPCIKKIVTWASISECKTPWSTWDTEKIDKWKQTGVEYYVNGRTKQQMPLYYQLHQDYLNNEQRLSIKAALQHLIIPMLICHGTKDEAVPVEKAQQLKHWKPDAELFLVESDHVFGRKHPWTQTSLPAAMQEVVNMSMEFLKSRP